MGNSEIVCGIPQEEFCCIYLPVSLSLTPLINVIAQDILSLKILTQLSELFPQNMYCTQKGSLLKFLAEVLTFKFFWIRMKWSWKACSHIHDYGHYLHFHSACGFSLSTATYFITSSGSTFNIFYSEIFFFYDLFVHNKGDVYKLHCISQTQWSFLINIRVLGQHVSNPVESSSDSFKN